MIPNAKIIQNKGAYDIHAVRPSIKTHFTVANKNRLFQGEKRPITKNGSLNSKSKFKFNNLTQTAFNTGSISLSNMHYYLYSIDPG